MNAKEILRFLKGEPDHDNEFLPTAADRIRMEDMLVTPDQRRPIFNKFLIGALATVAALALAEIATKNAVSKKVTSLALKIRSRK